MSAVLHLHLWAGGYRHLPTIGPLFLIQGLTGIVLAVAVVSFRRPVVALLGAGYLVATIAGFFVSLSVGLFGFRDTFAAPLATTSLVIEVAGVIVLSATAALLAVHRRPRAASNVATRG